MSDWISCGVRLKSELSYGDRENRQRCNLNHCNIIYLDYLYHLLRKAPAAYGEEKSIINGKAAN